MVEKQVAINILEDIEQALKDDHTGNKAKRTVDIYRKNLVVSTNTKLRELVKEQKDLSTKYGDDDIRTIRISKKISKILEDIFNNWRKVSKWKNKYCYK